MSKTHSGWDRRSVLRASAGLAAPVPLAGFSGSGTSSEEEPAGPLTQILPKRPTARGSSESFTGEVWVDDIVVPGESARMRLSVVRFAPCARSAWHTHARGQTLHVTDGIGYVQARGGELMVMRPGDTVHTPAGEWHWHGAAPDHFMTHLATSEVPGPGEGPAVAWGDHVTDEEYDPTAVSTLGDSGSMG